ncbi:MAG: hypothetical protein GX987_08025 [Tissierellia bacterium]|nr:hypothetical protein [Tissierellia bacterium]
MNYKEYMKVVEEKLSTMTEEEKTKWIYNKARTAKEHERSKILNSLDEKQEFNPIIYEKDKIEKWCEKVEEGDIYFECSGHEEYDDSYWDSDYVYDYYDPFRIIDELYKAFQVAEDLLLQRKYKESWMINNRLLNLSFFVSDRDTGDWNELEFEEVMDEILTTFNYKRIVLNLMYATYQITKGKERTESLYRYLTWDKCKNTKIEDMFSIGSEELKNIDSFMEEWISFLADTNGDRAAELLLEACLYNEDKDYLCEIARTKYLKHPVLFKYACEYLLNENKYTECESLGIEAISVLLENLIIRGEIADLTAKAAIKLNHSYIVNKCYEAAFNSESTLNNYIRLFELPDYENITKKAAKYIEILPEDFTGNYNNKNKQMMINTISKDHKDIIRFFNGEFDYIYGKCKMNNTTLGWSINFKGVAVPLFILLLNKDDKLTKAIEKLVNGIMYRLGFIGDVQSFYDIFLKWKEKQVLAEEEYDKYISWLKEEVDKRTEAVVGGGYRNSYYKAAILVVSLGEILESNGMVNGRRLMIEHYSKVHSRKSAFKAEIELLNE